MKFKSKTYKCIDYIYEEFSKLTEVDAICLGGSRATLKYDDKSDYDIYIYCNKEIDKSKREKILSKYCSYMEVNNQYWELEDNCIMNDGIDLDIIYRNIIDFDKVIKNVVVDFNAYTGYTTCLWDNLIHSMIIFDRNDDLKKLQDKYNILYPDQLKQNIITKNRNLLNGFLPSYDKQIIKAIKRNDIISVNHRVTEFLASYFDIIFALNKVTHPGEKRLIEQCEKKCLILPKDFKDNLNSLLKNLYIDYQITINNIKIIIEELDKILLLTK